LHCCSLTQLILTANQLGTWTLNSRVASNRPGLRYLSITLAHQNDPILLPTNLEAAIVRPSLLGTDYTGLTVTTTPIRLTLPGRIVSDNLDDYYGILQLAGAAGHRPTVKRLTRSVMQQYIRRRNVITLEQRLVHVPCVAQSRVVPRVKPHVAPQLSSCILKRGIHLNDSSSPRITPTSIFESDHCNLGYNIAYLGSAKPATRDCNQSMPCHFTFSPNSRRLLTISPQSYLSPMTTPSLRC